MQVATAIFPNVELREKYELTLAKFETKRNNAFSIVANTVAMNEGKEWFEQVMEYLEENINTEEFKNGFILDGFPRTIIQARKLADICSMFNFKIDAVINLDIPEDVLVKRLSGRRTCADCGKSYHIVYNPPKKEGVCDVCGGELTQRSDESEEAVQVRIDTYNKQTKPLIDYYTMLGELTNVDGNQSMDEVAEEIYKVLDELK